MHTSGIDIIEISRLKLAVEHWGERFLRRVYTQREISLCRDRLSELAVRFAGKEAVMKALGTGNRGVGWREIEILPVLGGKPSVQLSGRAQARAEKLGIKDLAISLSHCQEYAIALVVGEMT